MKQSKDQKWIKDEVDKKFIMIEENDVSYLYRKNRDESVSIAIKEDVINIIQSLLAEERERTEKMMEEVKVLMDKKRAKELSDNLETLYGERRCLICGTNPEKQRELILKIFNKFKEKEV